MDENMVMENDVTVNEIGTEPDVNVTDLAVTDQTGDSGNGIGVGDAALAGLALVGAGFLMKKAYDGGKWVVGKVKTGIESLKEKKAEKAAAKEAAKTEDQQPEEVEGEVVDEPENSSEKETSKKNKK